MESSKKITTNETKLLQNVFTMRRELLQQILDETRNIDTECGYPAAITTSDYQAMFDRAGFATRVVKLMPEECWNVTPEIVEDEDAKETKFEKAWKDLSKEFKVFKYLHRLDVLSGIGRFGLLLIGLGDGKKLHEPVDGAKHKLMYLKPLSESVIGIKATETDVSSPRFGKPTIYTLKTENLDGEALTGELEIHWTRVIHVAENLQTSETFGTPRMKTVYNYLLDMKKMIGGSAEMFYRGGFPGLAFEINPERTTPLSDEEKKGIREEFENYSNRLQRFLAVQGVTTKSLQVQVASPKAHFEILLKTIGIALGIPYRLLLGSEEAKLAGSQDSKVWNRRVRKRQEDHCTPEILQQFIDKLILFGILPAPKAYEVKWASLDEQDPKDEAVIIKDKTEAIAKYVQAGAYELIPPRQFLTEVMHFTDEQAETFLAEAAEWVDDSVNEDDLE